MLTQFEKDILAAISLDYTAMSEVLASQARIRALNEVDARALIQGWLPSGQPKWEGLQQMYTKDIATITNMLNTANQILNSIKALTPPAPTPAPAPTA